MCLHPFSSLLIADDVNDRLQRWAMHWDGAYENASTEKSNTGGWKMQVRKKQVQMCKDEKCKYGKMKLQYDL